MIAHGSEPQARAEPHPGRGRIQGGAEQIGAASDSEPHRACRRRTGEAAGSGGAASWATAHPGRRRADRRRRLGRRQSRCGAASMAPHQAPGCAARGAAGSLEVSKSADCDTPTESLGGSPESLEVSFSDSRGVKKGAFWNTYTNKYHIPYRDSNPLVSGESVFDCPRCGARDSLELIPKTRIAVCRECNIAFPAERAACDRPSNDGRAYTKRNAPGENGVPGSGVR